MNEASTSFVAAQNIDVGSVAECDNCGISSTPQLTSYKKLTLVTPECLIMFDLCLCSYTV